MWESLLVSLVLLGTPLGIQADEQCELKILTGYNSAEFRSTELRCSWPKHCCGRVLDCCLVWYFWILVGGSFGLLSSCCLICIRCFLCTAERANVVPAQTTVLYTYANGSPHHHHHHHSSPMPPSEDGSTTTHQFLVPATLRFVPPVPGGPFVSQGPPPSYEQTTAQASAAEGAEGAAAVSVATLPPSSEPPPSFEQATGGRRAYLQSTAQPNRPSSSPFPGAPASPTAADRRPTRQPVLPSRLPPINIQRSPSIQAEIVHRGFIAHAALTSPSLPAAISQSSITAAPSSRHPPPKPAGLTSGGSFFAKNMPRPPFPRRHFLFHALHKTGSSVVRRWLRRGCEELGIACLTYRECRTEVPWVACAHRLALAEGQRDASVDFGSLTPARLSRGCCRDLRRRPLTALVEHYPLGLANATQFLRTIVKAPQGERSLGMSSRESRPLRFTFLREPLEQFVSYHAMLRRTFYQRLRVQPLHDTIEELFEPSLRDNSVNRSRAEEMRKLEKILVNSQSFELGWNGKASSLRELLNGLDFVGLTCDLTAGMSFLSNFLGWPKSFLDIPRANFTIPNRKLNLSAELMFKLRHIQHRDLSLYETALSWMRSNGIAS